MPGENCALFGCGTSRSHKLSLFKIPSFGAADSEHTKSLKKSARQEWLRILLRTREMTPELKKRIEDNKIYICEQHFKAECILNNPTRKILITGSVPTDNLPVKSLDVVKPERRVLVRKNIDDEQSTSLVREPTITSLECLINQLDKAGIHPWQVNKSYEEEIRLELHDNVHFLPKYTIAINSILDFSVYVYLWPIPDDHSIYQQRKRSMKHNNIIELLSYFDNCNLCEGLEEDMEVKSVAIDPTSPSELPGSILRHTVPKLLSTDKDHYEVSISYRCVACNVILEDATQKCKPCLEARLCINRAAKKKTKASAAPAKSKASLAACGAEKLRATVRATRLQCKQLENRVHQLQAKIEENGVGVSDALEKDLLTIMGGKNLEATPHMKFFWEEQMKMLQTKKMGRRYHPQVIRFALSLHGKSAAAYREVRDSGALVLPSERVLRDYKNYFKPKPGINPENVKSLREKVTSFSHVQRFVAVIMDEMKIQSNLVFEKASGDLIGFVDLGDPLLNFANLPKEDPIATHALAFLVRGLCTDLKHVIAYFFTGNVTSFQLMPLFWRIVSVLELSVNLFVCAAVNDGASPNRKLFRLHLDLATDVHADGDVVYKTPNVFAMSRFIYFFADSPHLIKTARNCLYNSGSGSSSRYMWNDGQHLLFQHIANLFYGDQEFALHTLPKLKMEHVVLTPYSKMKVKLATQVLSKSVAIALRESEKKDVLGTAQFCEMINDFFDCTNVRSKTEYVRKRNDLIKPYTSKDDKRLTWLKDVFLKYLEDWQTSTLTREGEFSQEQRGRMFLSSQTYEGLQISAYSHIEAIKFLLAEGFEYVLTERFMQDIVEDYFGHQREQGRRSDNPTAQQFGYNDLTIASQRDIAPVIRGNVGGRYEKNKWYKVSDEPVKKRQKDKK